jgi:hypothetical protein
MIKPPSQAPFAPVPQAWFSFSLFAFRFYLSAFLLPFRPSASSFFIFHSSLCLSPFPPFSFIIHHLSFFIYHLSFFIYHLSLSFQLASRHLMLYA